MNFKKLISKPIPFPVRVESDDIYFGDLDPDKHKNSVHKFDADPLALIVQWQTRSYSGNVEIFNALVSGPDSTYYGQWNWQPDESAIEESQRIRRYFKNRMLTRRVKNLWMSKYMDALESELEHQNQVTYENIKILIKLPSFYKEGVATEAIFKDYKSIDSTYAYIEFEDLFTHVGTVERFAKNEYRNRYYFANSKKNLLLYEVVLGSDEESLLKFILSQNKVIGIKGNSRIHHQPGYEDFKLHQKVRYEFFNPNS